MHVSTNENIIRAVILDISGIYAQIYDQGYFEKETINTLQEQYNDSAHWRVILL